MKSPTSTSSTSFSFNNLITETPIIKNFSPIQFEALKFGLGATFLGASSGLIFGGVTSLMRELEETPARANLMRSFKLFSNYNFTVILCFVHISYFLSVKALLELATA